jgi:hypothetical protein
MRQPRLMKLSRININGNCFSSDVVSIVLAYFFKSLHSGLKHAIQFFLTKTSENLLQAFKKLVLISPMNPFEFFFDCRKRGEATGSQIT